MRRANHEHNFSVSALFSGGRADLPHRTAAHRQDRTDPGEDFDLLRGGRGDTGGAGSVRAAGEVVLDDGVNKRTVTLNRPFWGLHVPPGIWASEQGFSSGSICLVLASHGYSEDDYIRNYDDFKKYVNERNH